MLKGFRKHTKLIIWLTVVAMGGWGVFTLGSGLGNEGRLAGRVFGKPVYFQEFNRFYRATQIFSPTEEPITDAEEIKARTWQNVILSREAKNKKIKITDDQVRNEIYRLLENQGLENTTPQFYERWLKANLNETPKNFESQIREILRIQKLVENVQASIGEEPSDEEARDLFIREHRNLSLEILILTDLDEIEEISQKINEGTLSWDTIKEEQKDNIRSTGNIAMDAIINLWQISKDEAYALHAKDIDSVTEEPIKTGQRFALAKILDKQFEDESKFDLDQYKQKITVRKKQQKIFEWGIQLQERAQLEDYIPTSEPQNTPPPTAPTNT